MVDGHGWEENVKRELDEQMRPGSLDQGYADGPNGADLGADLGTGLGAGLNVDPEDLSAVLADDALLDALGGSDPGVADGLGDLELNALLLAWRRDIDSEPLAELVDTDTAVTTVKTAALARRHGQRGHKRRLLIPVAAAAAVLAIAFTGTGLVARDAQPGDTLWGLTKVLYSDHAKSLEAAAAARIDMEKANLALADGRLDDARKALDDAKTALSQVSQDDDSLAQLLAQHRQLSAQLDSPSPTVPGTGPSRPVSSGNSPAVPTDPQQTQVPQQPQQPPPPATGPGTGPGDGSTSLPDTSSNVPEPPSSTPPTSSSTPPADTGNSGSDPGTSPRYDSQTAPAGTVQ